MSKALQSVRLKATSVNNYIITHRDIDTTAVTHCTTQQRGGQPE